MRATKVARAHKANEALRLRVAIRAWPDAPGFQSRACNGVKQAKGFYAVYGLLIALAATIVLIPGSPLGLSTEGVQVLARSLRALLLSTGGISGLCPRRRLTERGAL